MNYYYLHNNNITNNSPTLSFSSGLHTIYSFTNITYYLRLCASSYISHASKTFCIFKNLLHYDGEASLHHSGLDNTQTSQLFLHSHQSHNK